MSLYFVILTIFCLPNLIYLEEISHFKVWGPGLRPEKIVMPARYFSIQALSHKNESIKLSLDNFDIKISGISNTNKQCRIWSNTLQRADGLIFVRFKLYEECKSIKISLEYKQRHISESPYLIDDTVYPDECVCPLKSLEIALNTWDCGPVPSQIVKDLKAFPEINWDSLRKDIITEFDKPHSVSLCHYVIKDNKVHRKCYGKYVGFNMFMDNILFSLTRKLTLPDLEFFVNLGDWPLASKNLPIKFPILSWCGNKDTYDIILPTYDITESTLENMGRVMLDMLSVQGNAKLPWNERSEKLFWRGRDANKNRLKLISISREHPDLFNTSITNFFFFKNEEHIYGPKTDYVSFFSFFDYKYQLAIDGTVAPYRMPYLLGGGSLIFKQDSIYYEHYYKSLKPNVHYVPVKTDLSDLVEQINWAKSNDEKAKQIAKNGQEFANENLLPKNIFCYHMHLFNELSKKIASHVEVFKDLELISDTRALECSCTEKIKDEL